MNIIHIYKKEMRNYFNSPIAYVFLAFFLLIIGFFFSQAMAIFSMQSSMATMNPRMMQNLSPRDYILSPIFNIMGFLFIFLIPIITMRLFSEEKKLGTIELLYTYPITEFQMVMGKFLAAITVLLIIFSLSFVNFLIFMKFFGASLLSFIGTGYLGLLLLTISFLALGMWISCLTADQATAALASIGGILIFWIIGQAKNFQIGSANIGKFFKEISFLEHFQNFSKGLIDTHDIVFFLIFTAFFIFLTIQILETRKWKG